MPSFFLKLWFYSHEQGGGWAKQIMAQPFFARGLVCDMSRANMANQTPRKLLKFYLYRISNRNSSPQPQSVYTFVTYPSELVW